MRGGHHISVIIPALNEAKSVGAVLDAIPDWVDARIVVDNGSTDETGAIARQYGARVIDEPEPGYGAACLAGIRAVERTDILVFLDADFSDDPAAMGLLVDPLIDGDADFSISDRTASPEGRKAMTAAQIYGNRLACLLMRLMWGHVYHDLGPFRAIRMRSFQQLAMTDRNFGWTIEMQIRAVIHGLRIREVPVVYRPRLAGKSKISGTFSGVIRAGSKILYVVFREALRQMGGYRKHGTINTANLDR